MAYEAKILRDSISPDGIRLTTMQVTIPRIILAEFNTHRMFSRNSASSRAIPVEKMLKRVEEDPFIPIWWGKNQKGMQAEEELDVAAQQLAKREWLGARDAAVHAVRRLQMHDIDLHKQIANRLIEPWLWQTIIVTATEWDNFRGLRCNKMAQPEIRRGADLLMDCMATHDPAGLAYGEWHMPLVQKDEIAQNPDLGKNDHMFWQKVSAGRCARVSYLTHDGKRDPLADVALCERLVASGHMSPLEHVARPMTQYDAEQVITMQLSPVIGERGAHPHKIFAGNFRGWVQYRKEIPNEDNFLKCGSV